MYMRGLGLDVNTLPVVAVGLGVGIDYGIYLISRMCDEFQRVGDGDVQAAVMRAILTTGEATFFVAFTMVPACCRGTSSPTSPSWRTWAGCWRGHALQRHIGDGVLPIGVVFIRPKFLGRVKLMERKR